MTPSRVVLGSPITLLKPMRMLFFATPGTEILAEGSLQKIVMQGTSMAAPILTAAAAEVLGILRANYNQNATAKDAFDVLNLTARKWKLDGRRLAPGLYGKGIPDLAEASKFLKEMFETDQVKQIRIIDELLAGTKDKVKKTEVASWMPQAIGARFKQIRNAYHSSPEGKARFKPLYKAILGKIILNIAINIEKSVDDLASIFLKDQPKTREIISILMGVGSGPTAKWKRYFDTDTPLEPIDGKLLRSLLKDETILEKLSKKDTRQSKKNIRTLIKRTNNLMIAADNLAVETTPKYKFFKEQFEIINTTLKTARTAMKQRTTVAPIPAPIVILVPAPVEPAPAPVVVAPVPVPAPVEPAPTPVAVDPVPVPAPVEPTPAPVVVAPVPVPSPIAAPLAPRVALVVPAPRVVAVEPAPRAPDSNVLRLRGVFELNPAPIAVPVPRAPVSRVSPVVALVVPAPIAAPLAPRVAPVVPAPVVAPVAPIPVVAPVAPAPVVAPVVPVPVVAPVVPAPRVVRVDPAPIAPGSKVLRLRGFFESNPAIAVPAPRVPVSRVAPVVVPAPRVPVSRAAPVVAPARRAPVSRVAPVVGPAPRVPVSRAAPVAPAPRVPVSRVAPVVVPAPRVPVSRAAPVAPAPRVPVSRAAPVAPAPRVPVSRAAPVVPAPRVPVSKVSRLRELFESR